MAGVVVSSARSYEDVGLMNIRPLREVFSAVFFASIGLHVYPSFVYRQVWLILTLTVLTMAFKFSLSYLLATRVLGKSPHVAVSFAAAISQANFVVGCELWVVVVGCVCSCCGCLWVAVGCCGLLWVVVLPGFV